MRSPRFASVSGSGGRLRDVVAGACDEVSDALGGATPDLVVLFVSPEYGRPAEDAGRWVRDRLAPAHLIGASGGGMLETAGEVEKGPAIALLAGVLPGAELRTFEARHDGLLTMESPDQMRSLTGADPDDDPFFLTLTDPFTLDADLLLARLEAAYPGARASGGLASGGTRPGSHALYRDDEVSRFGAIGLALTGYPVRTVVSQGCRPVGRRFVITAAERNKVLSLSGQPALAAIRDTVAALPGDDQELARTSLLIGRVTHEAKDDFERGDFVIRNFMGIVPDEDAVVVGDKVRVGQTVQLQLRDRHTAAEDLDLALARAVGDHGPVAGALAFSCAGRGRGLFGRSGHDVDAIRRHLGEVPLAGFFCNGEIGAVGGSNFVHGFTVSLALF